MAERLEALFCQKSSYTPVDTALDLMSHLNFTAKELDLSLEFQRPVQLPSLGATESADLDTFEYRKRVLKAE